jgi:hypothetical protein
MHPKSRGVLNCEIQMLPSIKGRNKYSLVKEGRPCLTKSYQVKENISLLSATPGTPAKLINARKWFSATPGTPANDMPGNARKTNQCQEMVCVVNPKT